jgi:hypothetical protein
MERPLRNRRKPVEAMIVTAVVLIGFVAAAVCAGPLEDADTAYADAESVKWFRKAAGQGYADAQTVLGMMYSVGLAVLQDRLQTRDGKVRGLALRGLEHRRL